jgi:hypothetical protein
MESPQQFTVMVYVISKMPNLPDALMPTGECFKADSTLEQFRE